MMTSEQLTELLAETDIVPTLVVEVDSVGDEATNDGNAGEGEDGGGPGGHGGCRRKVSSSELVLGCPSRQSPRRVV